MSKPHHKPENPVHLRAYLGINPEGLPIMVVSQGQLNPLGGRCQKSIPFPQIVREWTHAWDTAPAALRAMQDYFDQLAKR